MEGRFDLKTMEFSLGFLTGATGDVADDLLRCLTDASILSAATWHSIAMARASFVSVTARWRTRGPGAPRAPRVVDCVERVIPALTLSNFLTRATSGSACQFLDFLALAIARSVERFGIESAASFSLFDAARAARDAAARPRRPSWPLVHATRRCRSTNDWVYSKLGSPLSSSINTWTVLLVAISRSRGDAFASRLHVAPAKVRVNGTAGAVTRLFPAAARFCARFPFRPLRPPASTFSIDIRVHV